MKKSRQTTSFAVRQVPVAVKSAEGYRLAKRTIDLLGASLGLILAIPLLLVCAVWIRHQDGGPAIYRQWRVGRDGWLFPIYKLRTMCLDAESDGQAKFAQSGDQRVLPGCGWMRQSHVDELPQLWNILWGQMSLVGPRPERPEITCQLQQSLPGFERRLVGEPGLTGLAQVRAGYANDLPGLRRKLAMDLRYLRRRGLMLDLGLILRTAPCFWDRSAL